MQAVYFGGSGTTGLAPGVLCVLDTAATLIQWANVVLVIEFPSTETTALPGMPPHAEKTHEGKQNGA